MKKNIIILYLLLILTACKTDIENHKNRFSTNETTQAIKSSFVQEKDKGLELHSHFYKHYAYEEEDKQINNILEVLKKENIIYGENFSTSSLEISPYKSNQDWQIKTRGHSIDFRNNTFIVKNIADFDHEDTYSAYNINSGEHLLDYTYNMLVARIPDSNFKRYIGFVSRSNCKELLKAYDDDVLGVFSYASDEKTLQRFVLKTNKEINKTAPSMSFISLNDDQNLYENDGLLYFMNLNKRFKKNALNFAFDFHFYEGEMAEETSISFMVKKDQIKLKNIQYNKNTFELVEEKI